VISWKRLGALVLVVIAASAALYAYLLRAERERSSAARRTMARLPVIRAQRPQRQWRWGTEGEWVVHEEVRALVSWASLALGAGAAGTRVQVRRVDSTDGPGTFEVTLEGRGRPSVIAPPTHVWDPAAYTGLARQLFGNPEPRAPGPPLADVDTLLLAGDSASLLRADAVLFGGLKTRPLDPGLHGQAALLWASRALRETDGEYADERPFLVGLSAHLALAASLRGPNPPGPHEAIAAAALNALVYRQLDALDALGRVPSSPPTLRPWVRALTVRITRNPNAPGGVEQGLSGLEKLEILRALGRARSCRAAVARARSWRLKAVAEWTRGLLPSCADPERSELLEGFMEVQTADAARAVGLDATDLPDVLGRLQAVSNTNTHQPGRPTSVVPAFVSADAGMRHALSGLVQIARQLHRLAQPRAVRELSLATDSLTEGLPQRPLLELAFEEAADRSRTPSRTTCERLARLIADRPDLVPSEWWNRGGGCADQNLLRSVEQRGWLVESVVPGTGRLVAGPWEKGVPGSGAVLSEASRRAPWVPVLAQRALLLTYQGEAPSAAVLAAYGKLLDYDVWAMRAAIEDLHGADDEVQALAERICESDVELCAPYADTVAQLGRAAVAEKMWRRGLAGAHDHITLSNFLAGYVELLLDRGDAREALRIARRAADVYSAGGLSTLALARERLQEFDEAARLYAAITERYEDKRRENAFFVRYRQRHEDPRFQEEARRATAELFPGGLVRRSLEDFKRAGHRGGVMFDARNLSEAWRRVGIRPGDFLVGLDGWAVEGRDQLDAVLSFADAPRVSVVVLRRGAGLIEFSGAYPRWKYGPVAATVPASTVWPHRPLTARPPTTIASRYPTSSRETSRSTSAGARARRDAHPARARHSLQARVADVDGRRAGDSPRSPRRRMQRS
jgi:tetratricopeptide (TPR) repeat protein